MSFSRRTVLQMGAAALAAEAFGATIARALDIPAHSPTGTINDVEHVVILMQENRSFDHYFGTLRGVRGFSDPRPLTLPNGDPVWKQPNAHGAPVKPFRLDTQSTSAAHMASLDHTWKGSHARWKNHDAWIAAKSAMTMGYFTREDLPFYYALADAFTICDEYYCSIFGPTSPNRNFLFTGTSGLSAGYDGVLAVRNSYLELNETAPPQNDSRFFTPLEWRTYAERLEEAGISWKVYQEYDNYGDNSLAYFKNFRGAGADSKLLSKGRSCAPGSTKDNAAISRGEHLIADFANDVRSGRLPQVSWIVAPYIMCEHPSASPGYGQSFTARLLTELVGNPDVYSRTVFLLNYDENDGFFDHMPPYLPATGSAFGASTVDTAGEVYRGEPVGLGPRVPMLIVSPWSKGGWVNSQVFDHTSIVRFLEMRFGVQEPNISAWRRTVCGDLTSAFDFATPDVAAGALPTTATYIGDADGTRALPAPVLPQAFPAVAQEHGQRPARALPYVFEVTCEIDAAGKAFALSIRNIGPAGVALNAFAAGGSAGPWFFTLEAGKSLRHELMRGVEAYDVAVYGPNGFLRHFRGRVEETVEPSVQIGGDGVSVSIDRPMRMAQRNYIPDQTEMLLDSGGREGNRPGGEQDGWPLAPSGHWYDFEVTSSDDPTFLRRYAGHVETGAPSVSDPLLG